MRQLDNTVGAMLTDEKIEQLAHDFIRALREKAYGPGNWSNELEGDYGTWEDWRKALVKFGVAIQEFQLQHELDNEQVNLSLDGGMTR